MSMIIIKLYSSSAVLKRSSNLMLIWQQVMSSVMCNSLTLRHTVHTHRFHDPSVTHPWTGCHSLQADLHCMCIPSSFKAVTVLHSVSSQMPQCTHLFLKHTPMKTRTLPACPLIWVTVARWWMVSCMCTQRRTLWKSEMFVMNHLVHACYPLVLNLIGCLSVFRLCSHI